uniref:Putative secreted protein n=1 Tax=Anopheles darlingi TaxID=43151 RepID=A0A2M4D731_ANODA
MILSFTYSSTSLSLSLSLSFSLSRFYLSLGFIRAFSPDDSKHTHKQTPRRSSRMFSLEHRSVNVKSLTTLLFGEIG